jgi:hypothetical protein
MGVAMIPRQQTVELAAFEFRGKLLDPEIALAWLKEQQLLTDVSRAKWSDQARFAEATLLVILDGAIRYTGSFHYAFRVPLSNDIHALYMQRRAAGA